MHFTFYHVAGLALILVGVVMAITGMRALRTKWEEDSLTDFIKFRIMVGGLILIGLGIWFWVSPPV